MLVRHDKTIEDVKIAVLVGGTLDSARRSAAQRGEKPRVDVLEMEARFGAHLYDFAWLEREARRRSLAGGVLELPKRALGWSAALVFRAYRDLLRYDVVYTTGEDVGIPLAALLRASGKKKPKVILRLENYTYGRSPLRRRVHRAFFRYGLQRVSLVLCRTEAHLNHMRRELAAWRSASARFTPETVDTDFFNPSQPVDSDAASVVPKKPYIVSAGLEMRDYATLVESIRGIPVQLVIGAGSPWSKFGHGLASEDLPPNVTVQAYTPRQMRELYRAADLVVVPIRRTNRACGMNVILEAWSMNRSVVISRTEGLQSYVEDGKTGIFAEPESVSDLRAKIVHLLANPQLAAQLGKNGNRRVIEELNLDRYVESVGDAIGSPSG